MGEIEGELNSIEQDLKDDINGAIGSIAQALNIHDFYSAHLMDFCEGYYQPGPLANATVTPSKNVTDCSNRTAGFTFDPQAAIQSQLKPGVSLDDIKWPREVEDAVSAAETAVKAMFVLYCLGVAFAGLAFLGALLAFFKDGRLGAFVDGMLCFVSFVLFDPAGGCRRLISVVQLAFLTLGIASSIATAIITKSVDAINYYGNDVGIAAYKGSGFLGLTWAATALMFVAGIGWIFDCCVGPSRRTRSKV